MATLLALSIIVCPILYFTVGPKLEEAQLDALKLLGIIGALLLIVLFQGSSSLAEEISGGKYPEYEKYCKSVPRFFPGIGDPYNESPKHWIGIDPNRASNTLLKDLTRNSYKIVKAKYTKKKNISLP